MSTFVLVPGFWLGAWAWDEVAAVLRAEGHTVLALTPFGVAERAAGPDTTAEDQVTDVVAELQGIEEPAVLVGHSGAGPVVVAAAERARDRLARLVLVDSGPLPDGMAQLGFYDPQAQQQIRDALAEHGGWYPMPDPAQLARTGSSIAGLDDELLDLMRTRAAPEPGGVLTGPIARGDADPTLPKVLVACSFTAAQVHELAAAGVPGFAELVGADWTIRELPTGHWPMLSEPAALAGLLAEEVVTAV